MKIKLSLNDLHEIVRQVNSEEPIHLFNIHEGSESVPIFYNQGQLLIQNEVDVNEVEDIESYYIAINSIDQELLDIYCLKTFGKWYRETTPPEVEVINVIFRGIYGIDIVDPLAEELAAVYGIANSGGVQVQDFKHETVEQILRGYYINTPIIKILLAEEEEIFICMISSGGYKTAHHSINEIKLMSSKVVDSLERKMEDLSLDLELFKGLEKSLGLEKEIEIEKTL
jgi:hypothetical protein